MEKISPVYNTFQTYEDFLSPKFLELKAFYFITDNSNDYTMYWCWAEFRTCRILESEFSTSP